VRVSVVCGGGGGGKRHNVCEGVAVWAGGVGGGGGWQGSGTAQGWEGRLVRD
jgi:hypothetical protein